MSSLLLVEDDDRLRGALTIMLRSLGHSVHEAGSVASATSALPGQRYDCAIIDLGLPDGSGIDVIRSLRRVDPLVPILVLSARRQPEEKVGALDAGADDFVTKPFGVDELLARIRAALRRSDAGSSGSLLALADFSIDVRLRRVLGPSGDEIRLTPTEWSVLECLIEARGRVVEGPAILAEVWGARGANQPHYLRVYLAQLRQKLEPDPSRPKYLITVPGVGYRFASHAGHTDRRP